MKLLDLFCGAGLWYNSSMKTITCQNCGKIFESRRKTRKFCSVSCANRSTWAREKIRECILCGTPFVLKSAADANRKYCSQKCSKNAYAKQIDTWKFEHSEEIKIYMQERTKKEVASGKEKTRRQLERIASIDLLGGKCIVCGAENPNWLHIDFIPTTRNVPFRHPRHIRYIREHLSDFRILCANHHYELTLTGRIEGTDITQ